MQLADGPLSKITPNQYIFRHFYKFSRWRDKWTKNKQWLTLTASCRPESSEPVSPVPRPLDAPRPRPRGRDDPKNDTCNCLLLLTRMVTQ